MAKAKRKRVLESPPTSPPVKKERLKEPQNLTAALEEALPDQLDPVQTVPREVPQDLPQDVPQGCQQDASQDVQQDVAQDVPQVFPQEDPHDRISISNATNSPLLRLSGEIRNEIFAYAYTDAVYKLTLGPDYGNLRAVLSDPETYSRRCEVHLSLVCRQVHAETAMLPYELGSFVFKANQWSPHWAIVGMRSFLGRRSPRQLHTIIKVTLWRAGYDHLRSWVQTRTAAYWLAKLDGMVFASGAEMYFGVPKYLDIAVFGPTDLEST